jgi:hypothetical protein
MAGYLMYPDNKYPQDRWPGTAWAARFALEELILAALMRQPLNQFLSSNVIATGTGEAGLACSKRYQQLIQGSGVHILRPVPVDAWQILSLPDLVPLQDRITRAIVELKEALAEALGCSLQYLGTYWNAHQIQQSHLPHSQKVAFIRDISRPFLAQHVGLNVPPVSLLSCPEAALSWRSWYYIAPSYLLLQPLGLGLTGPAWAILHGIHDLTHLAHMAAVPSLRAAITPEQYITMEAIAMYAEHTFLAHLSDCAAVLPPGLKERDLRLQLLLGLLERYLRFDFDLQVHLHGQSPQQWKQHTLAQIGQLPILGFTHTFHGLPGFAAAYPVGLMLLKQRVKSTDDLKPLMQEDSLFKHIQKEVHNP